jgi:hypothetical protein
VLAIEWARDLTTGLSDRTRCSAVQTVEVDICVQRFVAQKLVRFAVEIVTAGFDGEVDDAT